MPSTRWTLVASLLVVVVSLLVRITQASSAAGTETLIGLVGSDFVLLAADSVIHQSITVTASPVDKIAPIGRYGAVAAAGDAADADRLVGILKAHATIREYETSLGSDVEYVRGGVRILEQNGHLQQQQHAGLTVQALASLARYQIASQLRSMSPLRVSLLLGGMMPTQDMASTEPNLLFARDPNNDESSSSWTASSQQFDSALLQQQVKQATFAANLPFTSDEKEPRVSSDDDDEPKNHTRTLQPKLFWLDEYGSLQPIRYGVHGYASSLLLSILDRHYRPDMTRPQAVALLQTCFAQLQTRYLVHAPQPPCIKCIDATGCHLIPLL